MTAPVIRTYPSRADLARDVAGLLADRLRQRIAASGRASLAVAGGTTPGPMLRALGRHDLAWDRVVVTLTDERWVPASSDRSNQRLVQETLLQGNAAVAEFVPLYTGEPEPPPGLAGVCDDLAGAVLPLDIAVLGMGEDMHTASLFPGAADLNLALSASARPAVAMTPPGADEARVTLSAPVLRSAERHILITGAGKLAALDRARAIGDPVRAPVCAVLDGATVHYAD